MLSNSQSLQRLAKILREEASHLEEEWKRNTKQSHIQVDVQAYGIRVGRLLGKAKQNEILPQDLLLGEKPLINYINFSQLTTGHSKKPNDMNHWGEFVNVVGVLGNSYPERITVSGWLYHNSYQRNPNYKAVERLVEKAYDYDAEIALLKSAAESAFPGRPFDSSECKDAVGEQWVRGKPRTISVNEPADPKEPWLVCITDTTMLQTTSNTRVSRPLYS